MVSAALTLLAAQRKPVAFAEAVEFMRGWFASLQHGPALPDPVARIVERAKSKGQNRGPARNCRVPWITSKSGSNWTRARAAIYSHACSRCCGRC